MLKGGLWVEEDPNMICLDSQEHFNIASQMECQTLCEADADCVGISWGTNVVTKCLVCSSDDLVDFSSDFLAYNYGFYRRPSGNNEV